MARRRRGVVFIATSTTTPKERSHSTCSVGTSHESGTMTVRSPSEDRSLGRLEPVRVAGDLPRPDVLSGAFVRLLMNHHRPVIHAPASAADRHSLLTTRRNHLNDVGTKVVQRPGNSAVDGRDAVRQSRRNLVGATVIRHFRPFPGKTRGLFPGTTALKHPAACAVPAARRCRVKGGQADGDNARAAAAVVGCRQALQLGPLLRPEAEREREGAATVEPHDP